MKREKGPDSLIQNGPLSRLRSGSVLVSVLRGQFRFSSFRALGGSLGLRNLSRSGLLAGGLSRSLDGLGRGRTDFGGFAILRLLLVLVRGLQLAAALQHSIGNLGTEQADRTNGIVVRRDGVVHLIGIAV